MLLAGDIDLNSSSGITGLNTNICKILMLHVPDKFRSIFANSLFTGIFPPEWAISTVKLLQKLEIRVIRENCSWPTIEIFYG